MTNYFKDLKLTIKSKLMVFVAVLVVVSLAILAFSVIAIEEQGMRNSSKDTITVDTLKLQSSQIAQAYSETEERSKVYNHHLFNAYDNSIKNQVENGISLIDHYYKLYTKGVLTEEEAKKQAKDAIRDVRYGANGYFFMDDTNYILQILPTAPEKEGMNRKDLKDPNGVYYSRTWVDGVQKDPNGEIFVDYSFNKLGQPQDKFFPKRSYCKLFKPWGWVLGTGNYTDDIQAEISKYALELSNGLQKKIDEISGRGKVMVLDAEGKIFYRTNKELVGQKLWFDNKDSNVLGEILETKEEVDFEYTDSAGSSHKLYVKFLPDLKKYVVIDRDKADVYEGSKGSIALLVFIITLLSIAASYFLANTFVKPILKIKDASLKLSEGDFTLNVEVDSKDEIGELAQSFNTMIIKQRDVLRRVLESSETVSSASEEISSTTEEMTSTAQNQAHAIENFTITVEQMDTGIQDITGNISKLASNVSNVSAAVAEMGNSIQDTAKNVEETAAAINEMTASIEQMGDSIQSIAENSKDAQSEAQLTVGKAKEGNVAVSNTIEEMDKISKAVVELSAAVKELGKSAEKIGDIVEVIDDIAEQTNLLSLNAAIEAARAGDAGKGFAVVANSIRSLAERSGEATKDIAKLIKGIQGEVGNAVELTSDSTERVKEGVQYVKNTEKVFDEIFTAIDKTSSLIQQIGAAIEEQGQGSKEIAKTVEKMNEAVIRLSATTEQQSAGADEIVKSIERINDVMQQVSATTEEQAASSQEVVKLIQGINKGTVEVSAGSEEIATSTSHLAEQAQELMKIVSQFKTK